MGPFAPGRERVMESLRIGNGEKDSRPLSLASRHVAYSGLLVDQDARPRRSHARIPAREAGIQEMSSQ